VGAVVGDVAIATCTSRQSSRSERMAKDIADDKDPDHEHRIDISAW
jgi:hypothetical protein